MKAHTVGVVKDGNLYVSGAGTRAIGAISNVADVIRLAQAMKLNSVWLMDVPTDNYAWWRLDSEQYGHVQRWPGEERETPHTAALYSSRGGGYNSWSVFVCDLSRDHRWPASMDETISAQEWAGVVQFAEDTLDMPLRFSPGSVGLRYVRRGLSPEILADKAAGDELRAVQAIAANWAEPTIPNKQKFWHVYDRNAAYLASMQSVPLGIGESLYFTDGRRPGKVGARQHAYLVTKEDRETASKFPNVIRSEGWYDGAMIRSVADQVPDFDPQSWQYWPDSRPLLRGFADALWALRVAATARNSRLLLDLAKRIYTETYGNLNSQRIGAVTLYRPHWHAAILAESTRRVMADVARWRDVGAFACSIDAIIVASNESNPDRVLPQAADRKTKIGGYKHSFTVKASDSLIHECRGPLIARNGSGVLAIIERQRRDEGMNDAASA